MQLGIFQHKIEKIPDESLFAIRKGANFWFQSHGLSPFWVWIKDMVSHGSNPKRTNLRGVTTLSEKILNLEI